MIQDDGVVGVVYQPRRTSEHCAVVLGGSGGGIPELFAQRVARMGITAFGVAYFGERGLPQALVDVPLESLQRAIEIFRQPPDDPTTGLGRADYGKTEHLSSNDHDQAMLPGTACRAGGPAPR